MATAMTAASMPISASPIGRMLAVDDGKPHRVQGWLPRRDPPQCWERAADVCGRSLTPPVNAVVLSIGEQTGIHAKSGEHPTQGVRPGQPERREFEDVGDGTASLIAALDLATGKVTAGVVAPNDSVPVIEFLDQLEASIDPALAIHLVVDNPSSHRWNATKNWLAEHARFVVQHSPVHAWWLHQVEACCSILTRKVRRRGGFDARDDLVAGTLAVIEHRDQTAQPFTWVDDAKQPA